MSDAHLDEHDTLPPSMDPAIAGDVQEPPRDFFGIIKRLGPGLIIAGSIVGSGELIATTKTGAQSGITLLWLIIIGCVIKVFVQIEMGRYTISHGETPLAALDRIPGPRWKVNWLIWYWLLMMIAIMGQVGGIAGGVGQSLAIAIPIQGDYAAAVRAPSEDELRRYVKYMEFDSAADALPEHSSKEARERYERGNLFIKQRLQHLGTYGHYLVKITNDTLFAESKLRDAKKNKNDQSAIDHWESLSVSRRQKVIDEINPFTYDDRIWSTIIALVTVGLLYRGRYTLIQNLSIALVVTFTFLTIGNVMSLQMQPEFSISTGDFLRGLSFELPEGAEGLKTAMFTFGIIGVAAGELITYPYWCLEKGYAKFAGPRSDDENWDRRARGWMMVMHYDVFASMIVYTVATLAFFVTGAAVLYKQGLVPEGMRMVSTLLEQYVPVFGEYARWLFLFGAIAVLYSTFLVANAGFARMYTDCLKIFGLIDHNDERAHDRWIMIFGVTLPLVCAGVYWIPNANPVALVMFGGLTQAVMLPMLAFAALYFRYRLTDSRLKPSKLWDLLLLVSCVGLVIAGTFTAYLKVAG